MDSDWAGCLQTRKSTSGGMMTVRGGLVKSWASTQGSTALSSGEAEYYAIVKGACEGLGLKQVIQDMGVKVAVKVWVDSSTAKSIAERIGLGKVRHMDVRFMWLQEVRRQGKVKIVKINGEANPADIMTKPKSIDDIQKLVKCLGVELLPRSAGADVLDVDSGGGYGRWKRTWCLSCARMFNGRQPSPSAAAEGGCRP